MYRKKTVDFSIQTVLFVFPSPTNRGGNSIAQKLDPKDLVSFKEPLIANSIQVDALAQLLIEEGIISEQKFYAKLKQVQAQYQDKKR